MPRKVRLFSFIAQRALNSCKGFSIFIMQKNINVRSNFSRLNVSRSRRIAIKCDILISFLASCEMEFLSLLAFISLQEKLWVRMCSPNCLTEGKFLKREKLESPSYIEIWLTLFKTVFLKGLPPPPVVAHSTRNHSAYNLEWVEMV